MASDAIDHGRSVLAALLRSGRPDLLETALSRLAENHFVDAQQKTMWRMLVAYVDAASGVLPRDALSGLLRGQPGGTVLLYQQFYDALLREPAEPDGTFSWHVSELRELAAERATGEVVAKSMEILRRGAVIDGEQVSGHAAARAYAMAGFADIDRGYVLQESPEGDVRDEASAIITDYVSSRDKSSAGTGMIRTGITELDRLTGGGLGNGEMVLVAAYTSQGKTSFAVQLGWHAYARQAKNVVVFTSETLRKQIRTKIIARHSRSSADPETQARFPYGLDSSLIRSGKLDPAETEFFVRVVKNFSDPRRTNHLWVAQIPKGSTLGVIDSRLQRITQQIGIADLVIIDYLQLLRPERRRTTKREELADLLQSAKELAAGYQNGRGVPLLSPWQISREGYKNALQRGHYETFDLAETHEAAATPDLIISLLDTKDGKGKRSANLKAQVLKNRDGDTGQIISLEVDYATSLFTSPSEARDQQREVATPFGS